MSEERVASAAKETWKALKETLEKAERAVQTELVKAAPAVQKSLDSSLEAAAAGFGRTLETIDSRTEKEQLGLLRAYRKVLASQVGYVDSKIAALEKRGPPPEGGQA